MNILIIVLGVIVVFLSYYIYGLLSSAPKAIDNTYLGQASIPTIPSTKITNGTNSNYSMGFWIFVNTFSDAISNASTNKYFVTYGKDSAGNTPKNNVCAFSMDATKPIMYTHILLSDGSVQKITITDNFPIQTWTYILVSVNSYYADCYVNGKLVVSSQLSSNSQGAGSIITTSLTTPTPTGTSSSSTVDPVLTLFGNEKVDVYITGLFWVGNPMDPQTVWNYYNQGNGNASSTGVTDTYHLEIDLSKNSSVYTWKLF
jgi:hypothetical protein